MTMKRLAGFLLFLLVAHAAVAAEGPVDRWAKAVGGRTRVAAIQSIYREGTLHFGGMEGTLRVWRTADGKYRKEEQLGAFTSVETYDGSNAVLQRGTAPPQTLAGGELQVALSNSFANFNAVFFVFFPERRRGSVSVEADDTIVFKPEGGIEWRVALDPQTSLPKTMVHTEGDRTVTVSFVGYDTVDGIRLENEIHRTIGDPRYDAVIRFTKTVINAPVDPSLFSIASK